MNQWKSKTRQAALPALLVATFTAGIAFSESPAPHKATAPGSGSAQAPKAGGACPHDSAGDQGHRPPRFEDLDTNGDGKLSADEAADIPPVRDQGFESFDKNGDGLLSKEELPPPGHGGRGPEGGRRPPRFEDLDTNGDGKLSQEEAADIPPVRDEGFEAFDSDGDGFLTREELPSPPPGHGGHGPEDGHRPPGFEEADANGDGKLSPEEAADIPPVQQEGFEAFDTDKDGYLTKEELPPPPDRENGPQARNGAAANRTPSHRQSPEKRPVVLTNMPARGYAR